MSMPNQRVAVSISLCAQGTGKDRLEATRGFSAPVREAVAWRKRETSDRYKKQVTPEHQNFLGTPSG